MTTTTFAFLCMLAITLVNLISTYKSTVEDIRKINKYTIVIILIGIIVDFILKEVRS